MTVILRKQSLFFDYDNDLSIDALEDARLQSFVPLLCRMYTIENDIEHIEIMLKTGGVSSPRIKNKEESFYLKSEGLTGQNKTIDWTTKKIMLEAEYKETKYELKAIAESLKILNESDLNMVIDYYEFNKSYQTIGDELYMSKDTVRRRFVRIRKELWNYEH